jgi:predicted GIY-YIG superfamily endonuclease
MPAKRTPESIDAEIRAKHEGKIWMRNLAEYKSVDTKQVFIDNRFGEMIEFLCTPYEVRKGTGAPKYRVQLALETKRDSPGKKRRVYKATEVAAKILEVTEGRVKMVDEGDYCGVFISQKFVEHSDDGKMYEFTCRPRDLMSGKQIGAPQLKGIRTWQSRGGPKWTLETLTEIAKTFTTRKDFRAAESSAYQTAKAKGLLNEICSHMRRIGNRNNRSIYAIEHESTRQVYVGLSYDPEARFEAHRLRGASRVREIIRDGAILKVVKKGLTKDQAAEQEADWIRFYESENWTLLNRNPAGALGGTVLKWTEKEIFEAARACSTKSEFYTKYPGARGAAKRLGISREIKALFPENSTVTLEGRRKNARAQGGKPFKSISLVDGTEQVWQTLSECAVSLKLDRSDICAVLKGRKKSVRSFVFTYLEDSTPVLE